jgi:alkylation response protein AidB-like acyl-CoA dehydrogenase
VDLLPSPEQEEIARAVAAFLDDWPLERAATASDLPDHDVRSRWSACAGQGWFGLGLDEPAGGVGFGIPEEVMLFEQIGRRVSAGPYLAGLLAARVAARCETRDLLGDILSGSLVVGLAEGGAVTAEPDEPVSGQFHLVDPGAADLALVVSPDSCSLHDVAHLAAREPLRSIDPGVRLARIRFENDRPLARIAGDDSFFETGTVLLAAALSGVAAAAGDQSVEHASSREQFGRLIGSYQAVKHRCADMTVRTEAARALTRFAAVRLDEGSAEAGALVSAARTLASRAALDNAAANILNHGGMGFSDAHGAHRLLKRAHVLSMTLGSTAFHVRRVVSRGDPFRAAGARQP